MILSNALSLFLLNHDQNRFFKCDIRSILDLMRPDEPAVTKLRHMCTDFQNIVLLTNSATLGDIQVTFGHMSDGNNSLR